MNIERPSEKAEDFMQATNASLNEHCDEAETKETDGLVDWPATLQRYTNTALQTGNSFESVVSTMLRGRPTSDENIALNALSVLANQLRQTVGITFYLIIKHHQIVGIRTYHDDRMFHVDAISTFTAMQNVRHGIFLLDAETNTVKFVSMFGRLYQLFQAWTLSHGDPAAFATNLYRQCRDDHPEANKLLVKAVPKVDGSTGILYGDPHIMPHTNRNLSMHGDLRKILDKHVPDVHALITELVRLEYRRRGVSDQGKLTELVSSMVLTVEIMDGTEGPHPSGSVEGVALLRLCYASSTPASKAQSVFANTDRLAWLLTEMAASKKLIELGLGNVFAMTAIEEKSLVLRDSRRNDDELQQTFVTQFCDMYALCRKKIVDPTVVKTIYSRTIPQHVTPWAQRPFQDWMPEGLLLMFSVCFPEHNYCVEDELEYAAVKLISVTFTAMAKHFHGNIDAKNMMQAKFLRAINTVARQFGDHPFHAGNDTLQFSSLLHHTLITSINKFGVRFNSMELANLKSAWIKALVSDSAVSCLAVDQMHVAHGIYDAVMKLQLHTGAVSPSTLLELQRQNKACIKAAIQTVADEHNLPKNVVDQLYQSITEPLTLQCGVMRQKYASWFELEQMINTLSNWISMEDQSSLPEAECKSLRAKKNVKHDKQRQQTCTKYFDHKRVFNSKTHQRDIPTIAPFAQTDHDKVVKLQQAALLAKNGLSQHVEPIASISTSANNIATLMATVMLQCHVSTTLGHIQEDFDSFGMRDETVAGSIIHEHLANDGFTPESALHFVSVYLHYASDIHALNELATAAPVAEPKRACRHTMAGASDGKWSLGRFASDPAILNSFERIGHLVTEETTHLLLLDMDSTLLAKLVNVDRNQWMGSRYRSCAGLTEFMRRLLAKLNTMAKGTCLVLLNTGACQHTSREELIDICNKLLSDYSSNVRIADGFIGDPALGSNDNTDRKLFISIEMARMYHNHAVIAFDDRFSPTVPQARLPHNLFLFPVRAEDSLGMMDETIKQALLIFTLNPSGTGKSTSVKSLESEMGRDRLYFANGDTNKRFRNCPDLLVDVTTRLMSVPAEKRGDITFIVDFLGSGFSINQKLGAVGAVHAVQTIVPQSAYDVIMTKYDDGFVPSGDPMRAVYASLLSYYVTGEDFNLDKPAVSPAVLQDLLNQYLHNGLDVDVQRAKDAAKTFLASYAAQMLLEAQSVDMHWSAATIAAFFFQSLRSYPVAACVSTYMVFVWRRDQCLEPVTSTSYSSVTYEMLTLEGTLSGCLIVSQWTRFLKSCLSHALTQDDATNDGHTAKVLPTKNVSALNMGNLHVVWKKARDALDNADSIGVHSLFAALSMYVATFRGAQTILKTIDNREKRQLVQTKSKHTHQRDSSGQVVGLFVLPIGHTAEHITRYARAIEMVHKTKKKTTDRYAFSNGYIGLVYTDQTGVRRHVTLRFCPLDGEVWTVLDMLLQNWKRVYEIRVIASVSRQEFTVLIVDPQSLAPELACLTSSKQSLHVSIEYPDGLAKQCRTLADDYWTLVNMPSKIAKAESSMTKQAGGVERLRKQMAKLEKELTITSFDTPVVLQTTLTKTL